MIYMWITVLIIITLVYVYSSLPKDKQSDIVSSVSNLIPFLKKFLLTLIELIRCTANCISAKLFGTNGGQCQSTPQIPVTPQQNSVVQPILPLSSTPVKA